MSTSKIEEAQEHIRQAEKSLKTGLLKWRPDYDIACDEYQKAATCYRNAKSFDQCKECLMKAAECHMQNRSLFHAAKCFEQVNENNNKTEKYFSLLQTIYGEGAVDTFDLTISHFQVILILKEQNNFGEIESLAHRACRLYQQQGSPEAAASALDKAAKIIENIHPEQALNLYQHAIEVVMIEDHSRQGAGYATKVSRIMVRLGMFDQAADALRREICLNQQTESYQAIGRLAVALVLVQLARGDSVAAEKAFKEWGNCCDANEVQTLEMLLQAYDDEDPDLARQALASPFIKHMDVEYARLARDLQLPKGMSAPKANVIENATASYKSPNTGASTNDGEGSSSQPPPAIDDDEEEGGLC
ncbi:gamma-soluble NSF attachment protein-like isoform X1 [Bradysia coprophila]|uniref:gamma-soluble NSF attachment protein-like isoform X1 n=1 Tax=Bradysia coprophila TaxID=38358 RepID=UPI00187DA9E8|nr:gamma-soluble NSF attachment protein-like isoform X1 [Bradysia coprophila]